MQKDSKLIRDCEWEEVFLSWYKNEGESVNWAALAKERGFASWADWRLKGYARRFECEKVSWGFYEIENAPEAVSSWFGGPFRTWIEKYYGGEKTRTFSELALKPEIFDLPAVKSMKENYPKDSVISALELPDGRIFVIEGMHRACALAVMAKEKKAFDAELIFAIGKTDLLELSAVGKNTSGNK